MPSLDTQAAQLPIGAVEAAAILGLTRRTLTNRVKTGAIRPIGKLNGPTGAFLFDRAYIERLAAEQSKPTTVGALAGVGVES